MLRYTEVVLLPAQTMGKIIRLVTFIHFMVFCMDANAQNWKWAVGSDCPKSGVEAWPVAVDSKGNTYAWGYLQVGNSGIPSDSVKGIFGSYTLHGAGRILVSTDSNGTYRWAQYVNDALVQKMVTTPYDEIYLFGVYVSTLSIGTLSISSPGIGTPGLPGFIAKLNSSGAPIWLKNIPASTGSLDAAFQHLYVSGTFSDPSLTLGSTTLTNHSAAYKTDVFVAKLDTAGNTIWATSFGGDSSENVANIACTPSGDVFVSGRYASPHFTVGSASFGNPSGGAYTYSYTIKFDSSGNPKWGNTISTDVSGGGIKWMDVDIWGNAYVTGGYYHHCSIGTDSLPYRPSVDSVMFVAKYGNNGTLRWAKSISDAHYPQGWIVAPDVCGNVWVCTQNTHSYDHVMLFRCDTSGHLTDSVDAPAGGDDQMGMVVDNKGNLFLCGDYFYNNTVFGNDTLHIGDSAIENLFIAKYSYPFCAYNPHLEADNKNQPSIPLKIFPNPATYEVSISSSSAVGKLTITNLLGQDVITRIVPENTISIDVHYLPPGLYIVKSNGIIYGKFLKE
jgi:Secretion system C-terminal sorting domain